MLNLVDAGARFGARCVAPSSEGVHGLAWDLVRPKPYDLAFQNNSDVICLLFGAIDARTGYDGAPRPKGRVLLPKDACETMSDGGEVAVRTMSSAARRDVVVIRTGYRVQRVVPNEADEIVAVEANGARGKGLAVRARQAVIFATGGFTHDVEMRKNFLSAPVLGGCAAVTNEGDIVKTARRLGRNSATSLPISDGPLYAALLTGGNLDTKGGPKTSADGKVLDTSDRPIPGLYGWRNDPSGPRSLLPRGEGGQPGTCKAGNADASRRRIKETATKFAARADSLRNS